MKQTTIPTTNGGETTKEKLLSSSTHLYTGQVSILSCYVDSSVSILVDFVQRDCLFLHELKQPQQDLLLERQTEGGRCITKPTAHTPYILDTMKT